MNVVINDGAKNDNNRKNGIDILKFIIAFLVICIHSPFYGEAGKYIVAISRCAVPVFFMITGFFYKQTVAKGNENKQIIKVLKLCIFSNLLFLGFEVIMAILKKESILNLLQTTFSLKNIFKLIFFNESPLASHLWYLNALIYVLVIMKFINKYNKYNVLNKIIPLLLLVDLILGKYSMLLLNKEIPHILVRNFLFVGLPYFGLGNYINMIYNNNCEKYSKPNIQILGISIFIITTIIERFILINLRCNATRDHYISTTFLSIFMFIYFWGYKNNKSIFSSIAKIGREYSTNLYIFHPIIICLLNIIFEAQIIYNYISPILVFIATLLACIAYQKITKHIKLLYNKKYHSELL